MNGSKLDKLHRSLGHRIHNPKSVLSVNARRRRLDYQVREAEAELRYWTR